MLSNHVAEQKAGLSGEFNTTTEGLYYTDTLFVAFNYKYVSWEIIEAQMDDSWHDGS